MFLKKEEIEREIMQAKSELTQVNAAILLVNNNDLACEIHISGMKIGVCNNKKVLPALKYHRGQIKKFINGEENEWE